MGKYTIFNMFENPRRGMQARNFTTNVPKILDLKSSSEQIFFRKLSLGAPDLFKRKQTKIQVIISSAEALQKRSSKQKRRKINCFLIVFERLP